MKRNILIAVAFMATMTMAAQNIAVVNSNNETKTYLTLDTAIKGAENGSIIYLPGGGWVINDTTVINKRLTIMGVSHRGDTDNTDGATIIGGNLNFVKGSSGSAVMGCYISGNVNVGTSDDGVNNILIKYCNLNSIQVKNSLSNDMIVNQCYVRDLSHFGNTNVTFKNNISSGIMEINGGTIINNVLYNGRANEYHYYCLTANNSIISYNVFIGYNYHRYDPNTQVEGSNNQGEFNITKGYNWGDDCIDIGSEEWTNVLEKSNGISIKSIFHLIGDYAKYDNKIGIYGGSGFNKDALAPIPRIVSKTVDEQTDGSGRLLINITVKAQ